MEKLYKCEKCGVIWTGKNAKYKATKHFFKTLHTVDVYLLVRFWKIKK